MSTMGSVQIFKKLLYSRWQWSNRECAVCTAVERAQSSSNSLTNSWRFLPMAFLMHQRPKMPVYSYRLRFSLKNSSNGTKHSDRFLLPKPTLTYSSAKSYIVAGRNRNSFCCTRASQNPEAPPVPTRRSQPFNRTNPMVLVRGGCHSNTSLWRPKNAASSFKFLCMMSMVCFSTAARCRSATKARTSLGAGGQMVR